MNQRTVVRNEIEALQKPAGYSKTRAYLNQLRPKQWTKNGFVFAAILFAGKLLDLAALYQVSLGFIAFCLISSTVYIINDLQDVEKDRNHPDKQHRPLAAGLIASREAIVLGVLSFALSVLIALSTNKAFLSILITYFIVNILYTFKLKNIVLVDVMIIAFGFVLRAVAGAAVISVELTPWFIICTLLLSLFIALNKRRHEVILFESDSSKGRKVLEHYSVQFLDQLISIVTAMTIMAYALYTFTSDQPNELMITIPLVIYGIFRYLYLVHMHKEGGSPELTLLEDKPLLGTVILYSLMVFFVLWYF